VADQSDLAHVDAAGPGVAAPAAAQRAHVRKCRRTSAARADVPTSGVWMISCPLTPLAAIDTVT
jgi:hypothetical protein